MRKRKSLASGNEGIAALECGVVRNSPSVAEFHQTLL